MSIFTLFTKLLHKKYNYHYTVHTPPCVRIKSSCQLHEVITKRKSNYSTIHSCNIILYGRIKAFDVMKSFYFCGQNCMIFTCFGWEKRAKTSVYFENTRISAWKNSQFYSYSISNEPPVVKRISY